MQKQWLSETARDLAALGGIPFLVITIIRVTPVSLPYVMQLVISSLFFFGCRALFRGTLRAGIGLILVIFTSLFYRSGLYLTFALLVYAGMVASFLHLKESNWDVVKGVLLGALSALAGYGTVAFLFCI